MVATGGGTAFEWQFNGSRQDVPNANPEPFSMALEPAKTIPESLRTYHERHRAPQKRTPSQILTFNGKIDLSHNGHSSIVSQFDSELLNGNCVPESCKLSIQPTTQTLCPGTRMGASNFEDRSFRYRSKNIYPFSPPTHFANASQE